MPQDDSSSRQRIAKLVAGVRSAVEEADYETAFELLSTDIAVCVFEVDPDEMRAWLGAGVSHVDNVASRFPDLTAVHRLLTDGEGELGSDAPLEMKPFWTSYVDAVQSYGCGDPYKVAIGFRAMLERLPPRTGHFDTSRGELPVAALELATAELLAGNVHDALSCLHRVYSAPEPRIPSVVRIARALAALIHALLGDPELAELHLSFLAQEPHTESWAEGRVDALREMALSLLVGGVEGVSRIQDVPPHVLAELWPLHALAVNDLHRRVGTDQQGLHFVRLAREAHPVARDGVGLAGSVLPMSVAQLHLLSNETDLAQEALAAADERLLLHRLLRASLMLRSGRPASALELVGSRERDTAGLRRLDVGRAAIVATALYRIDRTAEAVRITEQVASAWGGLTPDEVSTFPSEAASRAMLRAQGRTGGDARTREVCQELTMRERQMLSALVAGASRKQIASRIFVSENTVKTHLRTLYRKLGVSTRPEALAQASQLGLLPPHGG
ncbi:DNA-binding NarL/FixJ family response regulator [Mycolicibacterium mucogenicum 261Sha1.1M5]|nr:DNA-binding NarL/FixJ family response regulator [Mycolicibacterium mucogenicum 261Sha1.1M5]